LKANIIRLGLAEEMDNANAGEGTNNFIRLQDYAIMTERDSRREQESRLRALLEARPTEEQLQPVGEPSLKAARVFGEAKLATKSVAGLAFFGDDGQIDAEAIRRANRELIEEKRRQRNAAATMIDASMGFPSKSQLDYPMAARKRPVSMKALQILGDDNLAMEAKMQIPPQAEPPALKAMKIFGSASELAPLKARRILGSSDEDGEARALADKHWFEEMSKRAEEYNREVFARRPSAALKEIPMDNGPVPHKALQFFGDEELRVKSLRSLKTRAPPKAIHILGEAGLAGSKAGYLTGATIEDIPARRKPRFSPLVTYRKLFRFTVGEVA